MVTIKDLSKYTNISKSTISRYLNDGYVSEEKKKIIEEAIKTLGYRGNSIAKSLKTNRSMTVALLVPSVTNYFFSYIAEVIQLELNKYNYKMSLYNSNNDINRELNFISQAMENRVDGIIVSTGSKDCVKAYEALNIPIIAMDREISDNIPLIISDNSLGAYDLTAHLHSKGCQKILFIGSVDKNIIPAEYRKNGFLKYAKEHQIETFIIDDQALEDTLKEESFIRNFDAIMVWNDQTAFKVSSILYKMGLKIGEDILLTGYDNTYFSKYMNPPLTTANQPTDQIGETAVKLLMNLISGKTMKNRKVVFHNSVIKRESTGD